jgi:hypothetical protein
MAAYRKLSVKNVRWSIERRMQLTLTFLDYCVAVATVDHDRVRVVRSPPDVVRFQHSGI